MKKIILITVSAICVISVAVCAVFISIGKTAIIDEICGIFVTSENVLSTTEGYYLKTDGAYLIVCSGEAYVMHNESGNGALFGEFSNGDRIKVTHGDIMETYPGQMPVYECLLIRHGSIDDIPEDTLKSLRELGWYKVD